MSKNFICCQLIQRVKEWFNRSTNKWKLRDKNLGVEFLYKAFSGNFCEECEEWMIEQQDKRIKLILEKIEQEKKDGTFYKPGGSADKHLKNFKDRIENQRKKLEKKEEKVTKDKVADYDKSFVSKNFFF